jgi:microcystin-dependent protein
MPGLEPLRLAISAMHAPSCGSVELESRAGWSDRRAVTAMDAHRHGVRATADDRISSSLGWNPAVSVNARASAAKAAAEGASAPLMPRS